MVDRLLFSLHDDVHYLNNAYKAPLLKSAEAAGIEMLVKQRNPQYLQAEDFFQGIDAVSERFGRLIHAPSDHIALVPSVSYGFANALNNISCASGQHAMTIADEFPSGYFALDRWCKRHNAQLKVIGPASDGSDASAWNERVLNSINEHTAVVLMSSVHWMNGIRFDLKAIGDRCKDVGCKFLIDGTQSVGALPMNVQEYGIDALICAGYKWLLGPYSIGLAYYSPDFHDGVPIEESWMNRTNARGFSSLTNYDPEYGSGASRFNVGETSHFIQLPMLLEGLNQVLSWTPQLVQSHAETLIKPLVQFQESRDLPLENPEWRCHHLFGLRLPEGTSAEDMRQRLVKRNVFVSVRGSSLRISVNRFNTAEDIAALIAALE